MPCCPETVGRPLPPSARPYGKLSAILDNGQDRTSLRLTIETGPMLPPGVIPPWGQGYTQVNIQHNVMVVNKYYGDTKPSHHSAQERGPEGVAATSVAPYAASRSTTRRLAPSTHSTTSRHSSESRMLPQAPGSIAGSHTFSPRSAAPHSGSYAGSLHPSQYSYVPSEVRPEDSISQISSARTSITQRSHSKPPSAHPRSTAPSSNGSGNRHSTRGR